MNLNSKCINVICLLAIIKSGKLTSIMNDVHINKNELKPPTLVKHTSDNNVTKDNGKGEDPFHSTLLIPRKHDVNKVPDINRPFPNNEKIIGSTSMDLSGRSEIGTAETMLGDTVADAFLMNSWDDTEISFVNSSSLRQKTLKKGNITSKIVDDLFPRGNTVDRVMISGKGLLKVLFASINSHKDMEAKKGKHPKQLVDFQMSGIKVTFDNDPHQSRVDSIKTACKIQKECSPIKIEKWCQLNVTRNYTVALSSEFIGKNGTGVGVFEGLIMDREMGDLDREVFTNYVKECSPMNQLISGRIVTQGSNKISSDIKQFTPTELATRELVTEDYSKGTIVSHGRRNEMSLTNSTLLAALLFSYVGRRIVNAVYY